MRKSLAFLLLVLTIVSCKDKEQLETQIESAFIFYPTENAKWTYSDTFELTLDREYPNKDSNFWYSTCYATLIVNDVYFLGDKITLSSKSVQQDFDTTEYQKFEYYQVLAETRLYVDTSFAVVPHVGDPYWNMAGKRFISNGSPANPLLSGWIRFDVKNKKVFSRKKIGADYFDLEVFNFICEDCEKVEIEGINFNKTRTQHLFAYAVSGISLSHFTNTSNSSDYMTRDHLTSWKYGMNFTLEHNDKVYKGPVSPL